MINYALDMGIVELSRERHEQLLREAEVERLVRRAHEDRHAQSLLDRLLRRNTDHTQPRPECPDPVAA